jgi:hypothetical protein
MDMLQSVSDILPPIRMTSTTPSLSIQLRVWLDWRLLRFARLTGRDSRRLVERAGRSEHLGIMWLLLIAARGLLALADASSQCAQTVVWLREKDRG